MVESPLQAAFWIVESSCKADFVQASVKHWTITGSILSGTVKARVISFRLLGLPRGM